MSAAVAPAVAPKPSAKPAHAHSASQSAPRKVRFNVGEFGYSYLVSEAHVVEESGRWAGRKGGKPREAVEEGRHDVGVHSSVAPHLVFLVSEKRELTQTLFY